MLIDDGSSEFLAHHGVQMVLEFIMFMIILGRPLVDKLILECGIFGLSDSLLLAVLRIGYLIKAIQFLSFLCCLLLDRLRSVFTRYFLGLVGVDLCLGLRQSGGLYLFIELL